MSESEDSKCHCVHVALMVRDFKRAERLLWIVATLVLGVFVKVMAPMIGDGLRGSTPITHEGERLAPDRIER